MSSPVDPPGAELPADVSPTASANHEFHAGHDHPLGGRGGHGGNHGGSLDDDWHGPSPVKLLRAMLAPERRDLMAIVAFSMAVGVLNLAIPIAVQAIVNSIALGGLLQPLIIVVILLGSALVLAAIVILVQNWMVELIQRRLMIRTVAGAASRLARVSASAYAEGYGPELVNRFFDIVLIQKSLSKLLLDALGVALAIVVSLAVLAFYHPILLAFDVLLIIAIAIIVFVPLRRGTKSALGESSAKYELAAWLEEIAANPSAFRAGGSDRWILQRTDELASNWLHARRKHFRTLFGQLTGAVILLVIANTALLGIGGFLVIGESLTLGQLVAAELIVAVVVGSVAQLGRYLEQWYDLMAAVKKVSYLFAVPLAPEGSEDLPLAPSRGMHVELRGVEIDSVRGVSGLGACDLTLQPGESLAVVGRTGSGRVALVELLDRSRDPDHGAILFDGRDLRDLRRESIRRDVAVISDIEVVRGTIRENIALHRPDVTGDDIREALRRVGLFDAVTALDNGLETLIHPHTRALSPEALARLALARVLAGKPRLLVIDRVFDKLPADERDALLDAVTIDRAEGATVVLVTHDEAVAARCSQQLRLVANTRAAANSAKANGVTESGTTPNETDPGEAG